MSPLADPFAQAARLLWLLLLIHLQGLDLGYFFIRVDSLFDGEVRPAQRVVN
jgi:hypothetical protein